MRNPLAAALSLRLLLFLSALLVFSAHVSASPAPKAGPSSERRGGGGGGGGGGSIKIVSRQNVGAPLNTALACQQYSRIANLSTVGSNSTYRTVFIDVSPTGTLFNMALLNQAMAELPMLSMDPVLNQACGNLTALAIQQAAVNFTLGVVAQFSFTGNHASVINGPIIAVICLVCVVIILGPISAL